jgi:hypothetical protein
MSAADLAAACVAEPSSSAAIASSAASERLRTIVRIAAEKALASEALDTGEFRSAVRAYIEANWSLTVPVFAAAAFALVCPILWISRCCAHRCCQPHYGKYSTRKKATALCFYVFLWLAVGASVALAGVAGADGVREARATVCALDELARYVTARVDDTLAAVDALDAIVGTLSSNVSDAQAGTQALLALTSTSADASGACAALTDARAEATAIVNSSSHVPPAFASARSQLQSGTRVACGLAWIRSPISQAAGSLAAVDGLLRAARLSSVRPALESVNSSLSALSSADLADATYEPLFGTWRRVSEWGGVALHALALLALFVSACAACAIRRRFRPRPSCTLNCVGMHAVGVCWVFASCVVPLSLLLAGLLLPAAESMRDATVLLRALPTQPASVLGNTVCDGWRVSGVRGCSLLSACSSPDGSLSTVVLPPHANLSASAVRERASELRADAALARSRTEALTADLAMLTNASRLVSSLHADDFGVSMGSDTAHEIDEHLGGIVAYASTAVGTLSPLGAPYDALVDSMGPLSATLDELAVSIDGLHSATACELSTALWGRVLGAFSGVVGRGVVPLGYATLAAACTLAAWIWPSILLQIRHGNVGREPGCPSVCRCRCCGEAKPRGVTRAVYLEKLAVQAGDDTLAV